MKRVLMVAYHFPPVAGSSGVQRTLRFVQHLPASGWEPIVLTVWPEAYERTGDDLSRDIPAGVTVSRAYALDAARHLSIAGRYPLSFADPDRWASWRFDGVRRGLRLIRELKPDAIWSSYPIATAHVIGRLLQSRSGLPWIADFRDPMAQSGYPENPRIWQSFKRIEAAAIQQARFSVFTTQGAACEYRERYPSAADRIEVIENGYDEESFQGLKPDSSLIPGVLTLLHSGVVYPSERDPSCLFAALASLRERGILKSSGFRLRFRGSGHDGFLRSLAATHGLEQWVELLPPLPYREALAEMVRADALLLLQAGNCNQQIPAKFYEYLRAGPPILALTDPAGDTAAAMAAAGLHCVAPLDSVDDIAGALVRFVASLADHTAAHASQTAVAAASRAGRTLALAGLLDRCLERPA